MAPKINSFLLLSLVLLYGCFEASKKKPEVKVDFQKISQEELNRQFATDPSLLEKLNLYIKNFKGEPALAGVVLSQKGMQRLDSSLLTQKAKIHLKLTEEVKDPVCAALFTGKFPAGSIAKSISKLPNPMIIQWASIQIEAMMAELNKKLFVLPDLAILQESFKKLYETMDKKDAKRLEHNLGIISKTGALPFSSEGCWVSRKFFKHVLMLDEETRFLLLKAVFAR